MKNILLSIKIVLVFLFYPQKVNFFFEKAYWFKDHNLFEANLKKITYFIIAFFPMTFFWIYNKSSFVKQVLITLNVNSQWTAYFIIFGLVLITVLLILIIILVIYVLNFILKHKKNN